MTVSVEEFKKPHNIIFLLLIASCFIICLYIAKMQYEFHIESLPSIDKRLDEILNSNSPQYREYNNPNDVNSVVREYNRYRDQQRENEYLPSYSVPKGERRLPSMNHYNEKLEVPKRDSEYLRSEGLRFNKQQDYPVYQYQAPVRGDPNPRRSNPQPPSNEYDDSHQQINE